MAALWVFLTLVSLFPGLLCEGANVEVDVVVYGATPSGLIAAISAAKEGHSVAILERSEWVGGMVTGGLGYTDTGDANVIGGYALEFFQRVGKYYNQPKQFHFEPHVASKVFSAWIGEFPSIKIYLNSTISLTELSSKRITSLSTNSPAGYSTYRAGVFIDASYEGDLLRDSVVSYTYGREGVQQYNEPQAGKQLEPSSFGGHQFYAAVNPYDSNGKVLPLVYGGDPGQNGAADKKTQAYNFRLCFSSDPDNQVPISAPSNYDPARWELFRRYIKTHGGDLTSYMNFGALPNKKFDINNNGPISTDYIGGNWNYPTGNWTVRDQIREDHIQYTLEFFHFLATDPAVPQRVKTQLASYGFAKDEFLQYGHFPPQLYVRESLRMIGAYVFTQHDRGYWHHEDSIGMAGYNIDTHNTQRIPQGQGTVTEGDVEISFRLNAQIPYGVLTPKASELLNFLSPVCASATHLGYGSLRLEPQYMIMGQAAGTAASLAIKSNVSVQDISIPTLQAKLTATGAVLAQYAWSYEK